MSRSYKKNPFVNDHKCRTTKHNKRIANRTFRRDKSELYQNGSYKKTYCSWLISDYHWIWTEQDAINDYYTAKPDSYIKKHFPTLESYLNYHKKCVIRK